MARWREIKKNKEVEIKKETQLFSLASLSSRFKAFLTDTFLITTPIFYIVMYLIMGSGDEFAKDRLTGWGLILGFSLLLFSFFWYVKCQTPGMKAYNLKIVNFENKRITFIQALIRYFSTLFSIISFFLLFIPYFNKQKKSFQDIISNTFIINENDIL